MVEKEVYYVLGRETGIPLVYDGKRRLTKTILPRKMGLVKVDMEHPRGHGTSIEVY